MSEEKQMKQEHKDLIKRNLIDLLDGLEIAAQEVCIFLYEKKIIPKSDKDELFYEKRTPRDQATFLLKQLLIRGPNAFPALYDACIKYKAYKVADILKSDKAPHDPDEREDDGDELVGKKILKGNLCIKSFIQSVDEMRLEVKQVDDRGHYEKHLSDPENYYQMTKFKRGQPFILYDKENPLNQIDRKAITCLWEGLNFDTPKSIADPERMDMRPQNCFVVFNLSLYSIVALTKKLKESKSLRGVPKLIFHVIQKDNHKYGAAGEDDIELEDQNGGGDRHDGPDSPSDGPSTIPEDADIYHLIATNYGGEVLETDGKKYTRFIHFMTEIFSIAAYRLSLIDLIRLVDRYSEETGGSKIFKPIVIHRKKLHFFPGCYEDSG